MSPPGDGRSRLPAKVSGSRSDIGHDVRQSVPRGTDDPGFRAWQAAWRRRIECSRRLVPFEDGTVDPIAVDRWWP
jgi:hypothetical protein